MLYLLLAICSSACVSIFMRLSEAKIQNNIAMLVMNYLMCSLLSAGYAGASFSGTGLMLAAAMGVFNGALSLISFVLLQVNVRRNGVVLSSTFMKLGLLVTMAVSVCFYHEMPNLLQILGFLIAVAAIILINYRKEGAAAGFKSGLLLLLLCGGMAAVMLAMSGCTVIDHFKSLIGLNEEKPLPSPKPQITVEYGEADPVTLDLQEGVPTSYLNPGDFSYDEKGRITYTADGYEIMTGIDVSEH